MATKGTNTFSVGQWVEIRSKEEILSTLDSKGRLEEMPFMPEMFQFCGQRFRVHKSAHKTCDYSTPYPYRTRRLKNTVHLTTRCTGEAHGGCEAGCLLYWKEAWLKPAADGREQLFSIQPVMQHSRHTCCTEADLWNNTRQLSTGTYICQTTQIPHATTYLAWWDVRQYIDDYRSGNVSAWRIFCALVYSSYFHVSQAGIGLGPAMRWIYNRLSPLWGESLFPRTPGKIPLGQPTPSITLNLRPGELVRVKSHEEILKTLDTESKNRGMCWDAELVPYCGKTYRVAKQVYRLIDEKTAKMIEMKTPCIVLESVICQARYSDCRMLCPKSMYPYWREIWLERVHST
jgi:hypothetical protein